MRNRHPGTSPAKIAIAVADTIAAMAGIGAMKNVTGTSSAVAIVAVNPGTAPTNKPNSDAANITHRLYGSNTSWNARPMSCIG
jgi:sugar (pentulose or hexulose) kinase